MTSRRRITLRTLDQLPPPKRLRELSIANAVLDAIIMPEWELRYFSHNSRWDEGEEMASLRNGSGSHHYMLFSTSGAFIKGFDVDSSLNTSPVGWATREVPTAMRSCLGEPAFEMGDLTYCTWWRDEREKWEHGMPREERLLDEPLGYLDLLLDDPAKYANWASEYYEQAVPTASVRWVQAGKPLAEEIVASLNPGVSIDDIREELDEIGYPL